MNRLNPALPRGILTFEGVVAIKKKNVKESKQLSGHGSLPTECPSCNKEVEWDWGQKEFEDDVSQKATCPNCKASIYEVYEVKSWEETEN